MIETYEKYLKMLEPSLKGFFEQQKPYIFCKEGCAICCETGTYPFSKVEFDYMVKGYEELSDDLKEQIKKNIEEIKKDKSKTTEKRFLHACPFLLNKKCSIYSHRGLICRAYGLMSFYKDENGETKFKMPCCVDNGLNYSNVYDPKEKKISQKMWDATNIEVEPVSCNVDLSFLINNQTTRELNLDFGPQKVLLEWLEGSSL